MNRIDFFLVIKQYLEEDLHRNPINIKRAGPRPILVAVNSLVFPESYALRVSLFFRHVPPQGLGTPQGKRQFHAEEEGNVFQEAGVIG